MIGWTGVKRQIVKLHHHPVLYIKCLKDTEFFFLILDDKCTYKWRVIVQNFIMQQQVGKCKGPYISGHESNSVKYFHDSSLCNALSHNSL